MKDSDLGHSRGAFQQGSRTLLRRDSLCVPIACLSVCVYPAWMLGAESEVSVLTQFVCVGGRGVLLGDSCYRQSLVFSAESVTFLGGDRPNPYYPGFPKLVHRWLVD